MGSKRILCLCHDVTAGDVAAAVAAGYRDPETIKRFTAAFMGPCQGRACGELVMAEIARCLGTNVDELAPTTARPPVFPIRLGELAGPDVNARER